MKCSKCGFENSNNSKFFINCAASISNYEQKICPKCSSQNSQEAKFCINCSYDLINPFQNSNFEREEYLRREIQRLVNEKKYSNVKQKNNSNSKIAGKVILGLLLGLMLGIGGLYLMVDYFSSANYTVVPVPKIRITNLDTQISYNLTDGVVAIADITLTNYGNMGGNAQVEFYNDKNRIIDVQTFYVSAGQTKIFRTKVDVSINDKSISARVR